MGVKHTTGRLAKKGDTVIITKDSSRHLTKGKEYEVLYTSSGFAGQAVTVLDDSNTLKTVNGFWWDFPSK